MSDAMPPPPPRAPPPGGLLRAAVQNSAAKGGPLQQPPAKTSPVAAHHSSAAAPLALPLDWEAYFDRRIAVECPSRQATFNVYRAGSAGPVVLCLHGGGYTGLSWALFARHLKHRCQVVAPDLRGHGLSTSADNADLSAATLAADVAAVWEQLFAAAGDSEGGHKAEGGRASTGRSIASQKTGGSEAGGDSTGSAATGGGSGSQEAVAGGGGSRGGAAAAASPLATVLVGHSMGGAIAVHAAALNEITSLAGVVVVDVVEGTAIASLPFMDTVLAGRPYKFTSLQEAVDWAMATGMCRRREAAHISLPSMLREAPGAEGQQGVGTPQAPAAPVFTAAATAAAGPGEGLPGAAGGGGLDLGVLGVVSEECDEEEREEEGGAPSGAASIGVTPFGAALLPNSNTGAGNSLGAMSPSADAAEPPNSGAGASSNATPPSRGDVGNPDTGGTTDGIIAAWGCSFEEQQTRRWQAQQEQAQQQVQVASGGSGWVWRTPLRRSKQYWEGWYRGLSDTFLALKVPKVLVLAGTDRLDRQLTIGQMQGRFQLVLLPQAGHAVQEDEPERTAEAVGAFLKRFRVGEPPMQIPRAAPGVKPVLPIPAGPQA